MVPYASMFMMVVEVEWIWKASHDIDVESL
jgi:hypothetical protein